MLPPPPPVPHRQYCPRPLPTLLPASPPPVFSIATFRISVASPASQASPRAERPHAGMHRLGRPKPPCCHHRRQYRQYYPRPYCRRRHQHRRDQRTKQLRRSPSAASPWAINAAKGAYRANEGPRWRPAETTAVLSCTSAPPPPNFPK